MLSKAQPSRLCKREYLKPLIRTILGDLKIELILISDTANTNAKFVSRTLLYPLSYRVRKNMLQGLHGYSSCQKTAEKPWERGVQYYGVVHGLFLFYDETERKIESTVYNISLLNFAILLSLRCSLMLW